MAEAAVAVLSENEQEAVAWAIRIGIASLRADGFPEPANTNIAILESAAAKIARPEPEL